MARLNATLGKMKGKVGGMVMAVNAGVQIVREKPISVANPSTSSQVNQRAKLKLASQIAAALAPVIAIPRDGLQSPRNLFVKKNFSMFHAESGNAQVSYENLQLTAGTAGLPQITISRSSSDGVRVALASNASGSVNRVVYSLFIKSQQAKLQLIDSVVVEGAGEDGTFPHSFDYVEGEIVVYAYGMRDLSGKASSAYGNYQVLSGQDIAELISNKTLAAGDYQYTETRGCTMTADGEIIEPTDPDKVRIFVTTLGTGTATGAGTYNIGDPVTLQATAGANYSFAGWLDNTTRRTLSTQNPWTFAAANQLDVVAHFEAEEDGPGGGGEG